MANQKLTQLNALVSVNSLDLTYVVDDPSGTPVSKKCTAQNLVKGGASAGAIADLIDVTLSASKNLVSDANGKITITNDTFCRWRGASAGDPGSNQAGDIYKDTNDSNKIKIYDGSSYIALN